MNRYSSFKHSHEYRKILLMRTIGNFLVLSAIFLIVKTFWQPVGEEVRYFVDQIRGTQYVVSEEIPKGKLTDFLAGQNIKILTPVSADFSILIPKIGANAAVIANVNAAKEREYLAALKKGVAHAAGTAFPGSGGNVYLFAHSTDYFWNVGSYNAVFYLLYKLEKGDEVNVYFEGKRHIYTVEDKKIVDPHEVQYITRKTDKEILTLQTCWPPGTTLKRLLVFAKPGGN